VDAENILGLALTIDTQASADRYMAEGRLQYARGQWAEAILSFQSVLLLDPQNRNARRFLCTCLILARNLSDAEIQCQQVVLIDPNPWSYMDLGHVYRLENQLQKALSLYQQASSLDPGNALAHAWLGRMLRSLGRLPEALAELERAVQIAESRRPVEVDPNEKSYHLDLADLYRNNGQLSRALAEYEKILQLDPADNNVRQQVELLKMGIHSR
jgi:tetratricopeptide (TPR) repeat protein